MTGKDLIKEIGYGFLVVIMLSAMIVTIMLELGNYPDHDNTPGGDIAYDAPYKSDPLRKEISWK